MSALVLRPAVVADLTDAHAHDQGLADGLGDRFVAALDVLLAWLSEFPRRAPLVVGYLDVRRAVVRGFPFVAFCRHQADRIDVLRILHAVRWRTPAPAAVSGAGGTGSTPTRTR